MQPYTLLNPTAESIEIPANEWALDITQTQVLEQFRAKATRRWDVRLMKADSITYWMLTSGVIEIVDLSLRTAARLALATERGR